MGVCCCLQTCNSVVNMLMMGLVLEPSLMVISIMGILLFAKVSPLYNVLWEWLCYCLQVNYIVYKHFNKSLHIWILEPTCMQNFRHVPLMVFDIQGLKLNNKNKKKQKKNWRNGLFAISPMLVVQI